MAADANLSTSDNASIVPSIVGGLVSGFYVAIFMFSYASLIFSGDLSKFLPNGIGAMLFGAIVIGLVMGVTSQIPGLIAAPNDNPVAISAIIALAIIESMPEGASDETVYTTIIVAMASTTFLCGIVFILVGRFKLSNMVRYIPYPVIGGFLAGTGLIIFRGAFVASAGVAVTPETMGQLLSVDIAKFWIPALLFGIAMMIVLTKFSHFLIVPGVVIAAIGVFHGWRAATGLSMAEATKEGWLIETVSDGGIFKPISVAAVQAADWALIIAQSGNIATLIIIGVIAVLLNTTALESAFGQDVDMSRELQFAGVANMLGAFGGCVVGYHYVGMTTLMQKMRAASKIVGVMVAVVGVFALIFGPAFIAIVPKYLLGGLAFFIGIAFLYDWVYVSFKKLAKLDIAIILVIMLVMPIYGPLQGVVLGLIATVILFIINYSRINVIKHSFTGVSLHSSLERPREHRRILHERGPATSIIRLQGYIFFGTASGLLDQIRERAADTEQPDLRFVILDFQQVTGLDSSALHIFVKMQQLAGDRGVEVIYADVSESMERLFKSETFIDGSPLVEHYYRDLDHALEYCEDELLKEADITPRVDEHPLGDWLREHLGDDSVVSVVESHLEKVTVAADSYLVKEGDEADALYFVERGELTVQLESSDGQAVRMRTIGAGAIVGAAGMFMDVEHHQQLASVLAVKDSTVYRLSAKDIEAMEREDSAVAVAFQRFMLNYLAERLGKSLHLVEQLMAYEA
jgi:SulP family sulfate permease